MRDIIESVDAVAAKMQEYRDSFLTEDDIADLTDPSLAYTKVGQVDISSNTTDADITAAVNMISNALWG